MQARSNLAYGAHTARRCLLLAGAALCLQLGACMTLVAPRYAASIDNAQTLQAGSGKVNVGSFADGGTEKGRVNNLTMRGSGFRSPYNDSFVDYLREALRTELENVGRYDPGAPAAVSGTLLENTLNAAGARTGQASIKARFVVNRGGAVRYDKVLQAQHQWESSFIGGLAAQFALQNYGTMVQKLLRDLFADANFQRAIEGP